LGSGLLNVKAVTAARDCDKLSEGGGVKREAKKKGKKEVGQVGKKRRRSCWARLQTIVGSICM
jgi:hypothetical protein